MISANGVEYKNLPEQVQFLTERAAEFAVELDTVSASLEGVTINVESLQTDIADMQTALNNYDSRIDAVESTVNGFQASLTTAQNTANAALTKAESALSMIAGLHSLTKEEVEFEGDSVAVTGFVEGSLCTLTKLEGKTEYSRNLWSYGDAVSTNPNFNHEGPVDNRRYFIRIPVVSGQNYCLSYVANNTNQVNVYDENDSTNLGQNQKSNIGNNTLLFTATNSSYVYIRFHFMDDSSLENCKFTNIMLVKGSTAPTSFVPYYTGLKSVSISGLSTSGGVVITTSEGTTSLVPTLDDDTLELRSWSYIEQSITDTSLVTTYVEGSAFVDLSTLSYGYNSNAKAWNSNDLTNVIKKPSTNGDAVNAVSDKYTIISVFDGYGQETSGVIYVNVSGSLYVNNGSSTTRPTGYLVYELATPVTTVLATITYTDVSAFFEAGAAITVNNANTEYGVESTSTMYGYVAE